MKKALSLTGVSVALSAAIACATSDDEGRSSAIDPGTNTPDAGAVDGQSAPDATAPTVPTCSSAGWCITSLPDRDLTLRDIWPFESRAFAIAESPTLGVKILEWDEAARSWSYIDDNSQNSFEFDSYTGKIWAPNESELYFGAGPNLIYHGKRAAPSSPWAWERSKLDTISGNHRGDPGRIEYSNLYGLPRDVTALGVWGTSGGDVYAWYGSTIFHWKSTGGGEPAWIPEHVAEDTENPDDAFFIFGASGSSGDDVWFAGGRGRFDESGVFRCPIVIHKTAAGYVRLVDNVIDATDTGSHYYDTCREKAGVLGFRWSDGTDTHHFGNGGWLTNIESAGPGRAVGIVGEYRFAYVESAGDGVARVNRVAAQVPRDLMPSLVNSVWVHGTETWISGWGLVLRAPSDPARWATGLGLYTEGDAKQLGIDAATFSFSATAINGAPTDRPLYQVRGTSNTNLWAIGLHDALHKTTP